MVCGAHCILDCPYMQHCLQRATHWQIVMQPSLLAQFVVTFFVQGMPVHALYSSEHASVLEILQQPEV